MEACRSCLATDQTMIPLDEAFVTAYNLLTNLNISLVDAMPQYVCENCSQSVNFFFEFRDRCITTETSLREIILQNVKSESNDDDQPLMFIKNEDIEMKTNVDIKLEMKEEYLESDDDYLNDNFREDIVYEIQKDVKKIKRKKLKKAKCKINKRQSIKPQCHIKKEFSCGLCKKTILEKDELLAHIESHKNKLICGLCSLDFSEWPTFLGHRFAHIPRDEYKCHICFKPFYSGNEITLTYHYMKAHCNGEKIKLPCNQCDKTFATPRKLKSHKYESHSVGTYICHHCNKVTNSKQKMKFHLKMHEDKKKYVCEHCGYASRYSAGLNAHTIRKHTPGSLACRKCTRMFKSAADLEAHQCKHSIKVCPFCGVQLLDKELTRHMRSHSDVKPHCCPRCPAKYKTKPALIAHINRHDNYRPLQCPYCPLRFYTHPVLLKHKRVHTGEKPYVCKICSKGFTGNHNLKVHMKVHGEYLVVKRQTTTDPEESLFQVPAAKTTSRTRIKRERT